MPTTAGRIIRAAFDDIGVTGSAQEMDAALAQDGLRRLNNLVNGLQTIPSVSNAVQRYVFPLTDNQQTYTIGLGGDFNVPRPEVSDIQGAGLLLQGLASPAAITSITRSGNIATVTQTTHGLSVGDEVLIQGADQIDYNGMQTVQTVPTANTYTYTVNGLPTTPAVGTLTASAIDGQPVEIPRTVITDQAYAAIQLKNMPNAQFTNVYYNPTFPFGQIFLWPKPNTTVNQLVLYLNTIFQEFANLSTFYDWPKLPGYAEMLQYQLGKRLAIAYSRPWRPDLEDMANLTMGLVMRSNTKLQDLPTDAAVLTRDPHGWYNINTDTGG